MKKIVSFIVCFAVIFNITACTKTNNSSGAEANDTRVITDVWGRQVEIPSKVEKIVCLGSMGPRLASYLDVVDMMVGAEDLDINSMSARYDYSPVYHDELKKLPSVGAGGGSGDNNAYAEQIVNVMPDVILAGFSAEASDELQKQTGIPVVSIRYRTEAFIDDGFYKVLRLFADVVGANERCEQILSYIDECKEDLNSRTQNVKNKKSVYTGAVTFNGRHGFAFTYVNFPAFMAVNANNVADELKQSVIGEATKTANDTNTAYVGQNGFEVDLEQIALWNPDIIFLDPANMDLVNEEYQNNKAFFDSLKAVQNGDVYTMPSTNSAGPNITYLLINAYFTGTILYPEQFKDINIEEKAGEIMEEMLGMNFFDQMESEGLYYGKITIGE